MEAIVVFLLLFNIVYLGHRIAEHQKFTICQSCEEQNWTGELPAVDMKVNCSEVKGWCEEDVMVERDKEPDLLNIFLKILSRVSKNSIKTS